MYLRDTLNIKLKGKHAEVRNPGTKLHFTIYINKYKLAIKMK